MRILAVLAALLLLASGVTAQGAVSTWSLQPEMRIGSVDEGPYALNEVRHIVVSRRTGAIFIALYGEIRVFSAEGRYLRSMGRQGNGPGEFLRLTGFGWSGELLTGFKSQGYAMHFTEGGGLVEDRRIDVEAQLEGASVERGYPVASLEGGYYLYRAMADATPGERPYDPLVRTDGEGDDRILDRLAREPMWTQGPITGRQPLTGPSLLSTDPRGTAFVIVHQHAPEDTENASFRVRKVDAAGRVVFARTYRFEPRAVPPTFRDSLIRAGVNLIRSVRPATPDVESTLRQQTRIPRFQPPVTAVLLAVDGSIWLRREDLHVAMVTWLVLDRRGDLVGQLRLRSNQRIVYVDGDIAWGVEHDSLDVPYAVRYRIRR